MKHSNVQFLLRWNLLVYRIWVVISPAKQSSWFITVCYRRNDEKNNSTFSFKPKRVFVRHTTAAKTSSAFVWALSVPSFRVTSCAFVKNTPHRFVEKPSFTFAPSKKMTKQKWSKKQLKDCYAKLERESFQIFFKHCFVWLQLTYIGVYDWMTTHVTLSQPYRKVRNLSVTK